MKILLVDDEPAGSETLELLLKEYFPEDNVVAVAYSVSEAVNMVALHKPDLVFLDIEMPPENGFDFLNKYYPMPPFNFIFTTAYDSYALKAFRLNASDYLLKPVVIEELREAMDKVRNRLNTINPFNENQLTELFAQLQQQDRTSRKVAVQQNGSVLFIEYSQILYFEADSNYTHIHLTNGKRITTSKTLGEYETQLELPFFRIHSSYIANLNFVTKYIKGEGGILCLNEQIQIDVSRTRKSHLLKQLAVKHK